MVDDVPAAAAAATAAYWLVEDALLAAANGELLRWIGYRRRVQLEKGSGLKNQYTAYIDFYYSPSWTMTCVHEVMNCNDFSYCLIFLTKAYALALNFYKIRENLLIPGNKWRR